MKQQGHYRLQDALAKLAAQTKLKGGNQYTPDVALEVASGNKGRAMMRNQKRQGPQGLRIPRPLSLKALQRS